MNTGDGVELWKVNPFRYSGYQYDDETGMYYLKSRYYSLYLGRFITRDVIFDVNLYKYGANNPASYVDYDGYAPIYAVDGEVETQAMREESLKSMKYSGRTSSEVGITPMGYKMLQEAIEYEPTKNEKMAGDFIYNSVSFIAMKYVGGQIKLPANPSKVLIRAKQASPYVGFGAKAYVIRSSEIDTVAETWKVLTRYPGAHKMIVEEVDNALVNNIENKITVLFYNLKWKYGRMVPLYKFIYRIE